MSHNNAQPPAANQFTIGKPELVLFGSPVQMRPNRNMKRSSNFVKTAFDEPKQEDVQLPARMSRSEARRGSNFVRAMSEDSGSESSKLLVRSQKPDYRRGSSFIRTVDDSIVEQLVARRSPRLDMRRCNSFIKTTEDISEASGRSTRPTISRCSSFTKTTDDSTEDTFSTGRFSKSDGRRSASSMRTSDDSVEGNQSSGRAPRTEMRRGSSFIRMISEEINNEEMHSTGRLSSKPDSRRGSGISRVLSEDSTDDMPSRRSSRADMRRGSSLAKMISEEQDGEEAAFAEQMMSDRSENSDKGRKKTDVASKQSLDSISEYKIQTYAATSLQPSVEYSSASVESPVSDLSSDVAIRSSNESNKGSNNDGTCSNSSLNYISWIESVNSGYFVNNSATHTADNENKYGEWNNFWTSYNSSKNECFSSPYLCPSNSGEDISSGSNGSTQHGSTDNKISTGNVVFTADEVNEALECTQRLMNIFRGAMKRSETEATVPKNDGDTQNSSVNDDKKSQKDKSLFKSANNSCIDVILNHTGVADILKRVINKRREVIMPADESSGSRSSASDWSKK